MLEMAGEEKGDVVLGIIPTITAYLLPRLLPGFSRQHASVNVSVVEDVTSVLLDRLHARMSKDTKARALGIRG